MKKQKISALISVIMVTATIITTYSLKSPFFQESGQIYRMLFLHVPLAWISFFAFFIVMLASIQYLRKNKRKYDILAQASAEIGVIFSALTLMTGSIWARAEWGVWWRWDPRLTTTLITWIIYVAYITLRGSLKTERKARLSSVYGIIAFLSVPISYLSIKISIHPQPISGEGGISQTIAIGLIIGVIAFTALYYYILKIRTNEIKTEDTLRIIEKRKNN